MEQREPYLSSLMYGRVVTEEDDSQPIAPYGITHEEQCIDEEYLTYGVYAEFYRSNEGTFQQYPEY